MTWTSRWWLALLPLACAFAPEHAEPWTPPGLYREQWDIAQVCSGKTGRYERVNWHLVPGHDFPCKSGRCIGEWRPPHDIYIASDWQNIAWVIRHEIIHDLTKLSHDNGPRDIAVWGNACHAMWGYLDSDPNYRP